MTSNIQELPILPLTGIFNNLDVIDVFSFSLASKQNARIVRAAAVLRNLVVDVTIGATEHFSNITLYNRRNDEVDVILKWGITEARSNEYEVDVPMYDRVIRLQKFRGMMDLRYNNLCLPRRNRDWDAQIQTVVSYLVFIFPRLSFRDMLIDTRSFIGRPVPLDYAKCLQDVTRTENVAIRPKTRGISRQVQSLMRHLEITNYVHIEEEDIPYIPAYRFATAAEICLADGRFLDQTSLLSMNCVNIEIMKSRFRTEDFVAFLNTWKGSNEALRRVQTVQIGHARGVRNLYDEVGAVRWNPPRRPPALDGGRDICKPDGLVGTILQTDEVFVFKVWHRQIN